MSVYSREKTKSFDKLADVNSMLDRISKGNYQVQDAVQLWNGVKTAMTMINTKNKDDRMQLILKKAI